LCKACHAVGHTPYSEVCIVHGKQNRKWIENIKDYLLKSPKPFMKTFYEGERKRLGILMQKGNLPEGGQYSYDVENRKKAPKDFDPNHPAIEFLKLKSFTASQKIDDKLFTDADFSKMVAHKLIVLKPMNDFLKRALETEE
jgi:deoxyribodipyrimidine photolyase-like uncharacterized protein